MNYYVERSVNGRVEWLKIATPDEIWSGAFCLVGEIPPQYVPS